MVAQLDGIFSKQLRELGLQRYSLDVLTDDLAAAVSTAEHVFASTPNSASCVHIISAAIDKVAAAAELCVNANVTPCHSNEPGWQVSGEKGKHDHQSILHASAS